MRFFLLSAFVTTFFIVCGDYSLPPTEMVTSGNGGDCGLCRDLWYNDKIGEDFDSALDSLIKIREPHRAGYISYSGEFNVMKEVIDETWNVDFLDNNKTFTHISFWDKNRVNLILWDGDVIDSEGNHFHFWCKNPQCPQDVTVNDVLRFCS